MRACDRGRSRGCRRLQGIGFRLFMPEARKNPPHER